jgi:hypothetical protein
LGCGGDGDVVGDEVGRRGGGLCDGSWSWDGDGREEDREFNLSSVFFECSLFCQVLSEPTKCQFSVLIRVYKNSVKEPIGFNKELIEHPKSIINAHKHPS